MNKRVTKDTTTTESAQDIGVTNVTTQADIRTRRHATPPKSSMAMVRDCQKIINQNQGKMKLDPRVLRSRFDTRCAESGKRIKKGDECIYYPIDRKVYHLDSKQATDFRNWKMDVDVLGNNY